MRCHEAHALAGAFPFRSCISFLHRVLSSVPPLGRIARNCAGALCAPGRAPALPRAGRRRRVSRPFPPQAEARSRQAGDRDAPAPCHEMSCSVMRCHEAHALADALPCHSRIPFLHRVPFLPPPPAPNAAGPFAARIASACARASAPARFARPIARAREAGPGRTSPVPRKGAENPAARVRRRAPVVVHDVEHNRNLRRFQPLRGDFPGTMDGGRRRRRAGPGYCRPISAVSVSNRRRQAGQRSCTVSGFICRSRSLAWPILR